MRYARALLATTVPSILAVAFAGASGCGSEDAVSATPDAAVDTGLDATSGGPEGGGSPGDGGAPGPTCANFADEVGPYESLGTGVLQGNDVEGSFCARVKVRSGSYNNASPSDLVLELAGIDPSFMHTKPATVGGRLNGYVGLNTTSAGTSASTDPGQCGNIFTRVFLAPSPADHDRCKADAGEPSGCPSNCYRTCSSGDAGCDGIPCQPIPDGITYSAALAGNCLGVITTPVGAWTVTLTSLESSGADARYTAHGTLEGTLIRGGDDGDGGAAGTPATLTVTF